MQERKILLLPEFEPSHPAPSLSIYRLSYPNSHLFDMFPIQNGLKQEDALSPLLFNFALEHAIRKV
jgi:hypothetical protein